MTTSAYRPGSRGPRRWHRGEPLRETAEWFASADDTAWPFSVVTIRQHLGIEPEYIRAGLRRWRERHNARVPDALGALRLRIRRVRGSRHRIVPPRCWRTEA